MTRQTERERERENLRFCFRSTNKKLKTKENPKHSDEECILWGRGGSVSKNGLLLRCYIHKRKESSCVLIVYLIMHGDTDTDTHKTSRVD